MALLNFPNFWDETHPLTQKQKELWARLVPDNGPCETVEGEMMRAATRIHYDLFNNGWGCNNWSGAVKYLSTYAPVHAPSLDLRLLNKVHGYSHGEPVPRDWNDWRVTHYKIVTDIVEAVVKDIDLEGDLTPNSVDMFDLQESNYELEEDDPDDEYS